MKRFVFDEDCQLVGVEEADPVCGEDFCDCCGDCLACEPEGPCYGGSQTESDHLWVRYIEE